LAGGSGPPDTQEPGRRCAICGSYRHTVILDVPPRLIPCDDLQKAAEDVNEPTE
jgi:hypothetical protein